MLLLLLLFKSRVGNERAEEVSTPLQVTQLSSDFICSAFKDGFKWINILLVVLSLAPGNSGVRGSLLSDCHLGRRETKNTLWIKTTKNSWWPSNCKWKWDGIWPGIMWQKFRRLRNDQENIYKWQTNWITHWLCAVTEWNLFLTAMPYSFIPVSLWIRRFGDHLSLSCPSCSIISSCAY